MSVQDLVKKNGRGSFVLAGEDGNAFAIMGRVKRGLLNAGWPREDTNYILKEMQSGDYDHLLLVALTVQETVSI
jgi:hypothetical protein